MIPKAYRLILDSHHPFRGQKHSFSWGLVIIAPATTPQWSISVSKQAKPLAVDRNRLRRQLTHLLYRHHHQLTPPTALRIIISQPHPDLQKIESQLCSLLSIKP